MSSMATTIRACAGRPRRKRQPSPMSLQTFCGVFERVKRISPVRNAREIVAAMPVWVITIAEPTTRPSNRRCSSAAFCLITILRSKSAPAPKPKYSCVGRA